MGTLALLLFSAILFGRLVHSVYLETSDKQSRHTVNSDLSFSETMLVSAFATGLLFFVFFHFSGWILSFHKNIPLSEFTPDIRPYTTEYDGIETFALYCLMFTNIFIAGLFAYVVRRSKQKKVLGKLVVIVMVLVGGWFFYSIGFSPPMAWTEANSVMVPASFGLLGVSLYFLYKRNRLIAMLVTSILIAFAGLISFAPTNLFDFSFILAPALRLQHGFKFSEIYFQYDFFLSMLACTWMKLNLDLAWFAYLGWTSFFMLFIGLFFFADNFFKSKGLSVLFVIGLMMVRLYSSTPGYFQILPLRLDLWVLLLLIIHKKGAYHWLVGICVSLLIVFHRNLGLIYMASYLELVIVLFFIDLVNLMQVQKLSTGDLVSLVTIHLRRNILNIALICASIACCYIFFHELFSLSARTYREIGIGMIPISKVSFYWYVPLMLSCLCVFIFYQRHRFGSRYFTSAVFIVLLAIGNSLYFFGRSHENNILNISAILVLSVFVLFDVLIYLFPGMSFDVSIPYRSKAQDVLDRGIMTRLVAGRFYVLMPILFILFCGYFYSQPIGKNVAIQYEHFLNRQIGNSLQPVDRHLPSVKKITNSSSKVYFFDFGDDFYYYYYGRYTPIGYYSPCTSCIFKKDLLVFLQDLLDRGYYIVYNDRSYKLLCEYVPCLKFTEMYRDEDMVSLRKGEDTRFLLSGSLPVKYHVRITDSAGLMSWDHSGLYVGREFTIEMLLKPMGSQVNGAAILNNMELFKGFGLQYVDSIRGYRFTISTGTDSVKRLFFQLENNRWNYIAIVVNRKFVKVFDNGRLLSSVYNNGDPGVSAYVNSDRALSIANSGNGADKFAGSIKEIKISNGNICEQDIVHVGEILNTQLNSLPVISSR